MSIDTHGQTINFGKHKGELWTRVPVGYLRWLVNEQARDWQTAKAELDRRGTTLPTIEISNHAIDRASLRLYGRWRHEKGEDEGLYTWLHRYAEKAWKHVKDGEDSVVFGGIKFVFERDGQWPVLKTVMPKGGKKWTCSPRT